MGNTILSIISVLAFVTILFGLVASTSSEIYNNPLLDNDSRANLANLLVQYDSIDISNSTESNATINSTFEGTDAFQREFLESKAVSQGDKNLMEKIIGVPNLILVSLGVEQDNTTTVILSVIVLILGIIIGLAIFEGWKTGKVS